MTYNLFGGMLNLAQSISRSDKRVDCDKMKETFAYIVRHMKDISF